MKCSRRPDWYFVALLFAIYIYALGIGYEAGNFAQSIGHGLYR